MLNPAEQDRSDSILNIALEFTASVDVDAAKDIFDGESLHQDFTTVNESIGEEQEEVEESEETMLASQEVRKSLKAMRKAVCTLALLNLSSLGNSKLSKKDLVHSRIKAQDRELMRTELATEMYTYVARQRQHEIVATVAAYIFDDMKNVEDPGWYDTINQHRDE